MAIYRSSNNCVTADHFSHLITSPKERRAEDASVSPPKKESQFDFCQLDLRNCRICEKQTEFVAHQPHTLRAVTYFYDIDMNLEAEAGYAPTLCATCRRSIKSAQIAFGKKRRTADRAELIREVKEKYELPLTVAPTESIVPPVESNDDDDTGSTPRKPHTCSACGNVGHHKKSKNCPKWEPKQKQRRGVKSLKELHSRQKRRRLHELSQFLFTQEAKGENLIDLSFASLISVLWTKKKVTSARKIEKIWKGEEDTKITPKQFLALAIGLSLTERQVMKMLRFFKLRGHYILPSYASYCKVKRQRHQPMERQTDGQEASMEGQTDGQEPPMEGQTEGQEPPMEGQIDGQEPSM